MDVGVHVGCVADLRGLESMRWSSHVLIEPLMVVSVVVLGFLFKGWLSKQIFVSSFNDISTFN